MVDRKVWEELVSKVGDTATLVAVSKTKPISDIEDLYELGQRNFGENYVQELVDKQVQLPADVKWHFIGHLQSNKVKFIAPFVHLIHAVDSIKLLEEISKQGSKCNRVIDVLLQLHIADEDTKFGMNETEIFKLLDEFAATPNKFTHVRICGLMGMASFTDNREQIEREFKRLNNCFIHLSETTFFNKHFFSIRSFGMSSDYQIALAQGSNMIRIGSMLFGSRG